MNKKGFTLIELLAIIVILAIIAVITVPIILNIVDDATKNAAVDSAYGYKEAINKFYASKLLQDKDYYIPSGSYYVDGDTGYLEGTETLDIAVSGKIPSFGKVIIGSDSKVEEIQLCINDYMVSYIDEDMNVVKGCTPVEPGLYDQSNNLVVSYDYLVSEYGFDPSIDRNYQSRNELNDILANYSDGAKLVLPDTVTKIGDYVFYRNTNLTSITIPSSVTSIGDDAFYNCSNLKSVTFESGSQLASIGEWAFYSSGLTSITIPSSVTSIGNSVFRHTDLTSITIPSSVTSIGNYAFSDCSNLRSVTFESGSQLASIGNYAFSDNENLTSITIPSGVTSIGNNAFNNIKIVYYTGSATGSPWGALSVNPYIDGDFVYSDNTKTTLQAYIGTSSSVTIPSSVTSIGDKAFYENKNLTSITIPSGVTSIGDYAFYYNVGLTSITIPSSVISIGNNVFSVCSNLSNVTFESGSQLTSIGNNAFSNAGLISITIPSSVTSIGSGAFNNIKIVYYTGSASGSPWGANSVNPYIEGDFVYSDNTKTVLQAYLGSSSTVTIPSSVTSIGDKAFYENKNLTSITIPSSVTSIGDYAFYNNIDLTSITIPSSVTSIGSYTFYNCSNLSNVTFESGSQLTSIGSYAFPSTKLRVITIPSSVTSIGSYAFSGIKVLNYTGSATGSPWGAITLNPYVDGDFVYSNSTKKALKAYIGASSTVTIPSGVTSIGANAFSNLGLTLVTIPSSVTSIEGTAFSNSGLQSITVPSSVTSIGWWAFMGMDTVYYSGSATGSPWGAGSVVSQ